MHMLNACFAGVMHLPSTYTLPAALHCSAGVGVGVLAMPPPPQPAKVAASRSAIPNTYNLLMGVFTQNNIE